MRHVLKDTRGIEINTTGDGFLCRFEGVAQALTAATRIRDRVRALDLEVRQGLHVGEVEIRGRDLAGLAVHEAARIAARATAGEILVSAVAQSLAGTAFSFDAIGPTTLKGIEGPRELYRFCGRR